MLLCVFDLLVMLCQTQNGATCLHQTVNAAPQNTDILQLLLPVVADFNAMDKVMLHNWFCDAELCSCREAEQH